MKVALANLPNKKKLVRKMRCNVFTDTYLFPPIELISMASIPKNVLFIDAIAENIGKEEFTKKVFDYMPDIIIFLSGFETFENEIKFVQVFRKKGIKVGCMGYLPSLFPYRALKKGLDFVIVGEPETALKKIIEKKAKPKGIMWGEFGNLDDYPLPKYELLKNRYYDIFLPKPFATIETSRGCPFNCIYCIKPYGKNIRRKSVRRVVKELEILKKLGYKYIRFLDDLFTYDKNWVIKLCKEIIKKKMDMKFVCLTRPDTIDKEMVRWMKKAGFIRILIGVESGSNRMLKFYRRGYDKKTLLERLKMLKKEKMETIGWFIVSYKDNKKSIDESLEIADLLDWIVVSVLEPRPGTELFKKSKKKFSLFPYKSQFSKEIMEKEKKWEKYFLWRFYTKPGNLLKIIKMFLKYPKQTTSSFISVMGYFIFNKGPRPDVF